MERLKSIKNTLISCIESQMGCLEKVDAKELGEVVDMVKDIEEAIYYCTIVKAMHDNEGRDNIKDYSYYQDCYLYPHSRYMDQCEERMYHINSYMMPEEPKKHYSNSSSVEWKNSSDGSSGDNSHHKEGKSHKTRRMYLESKEHNQDKIAQMRELEKYVQELTQDIVEMVEDASPEEKQYLSKRITALGNKVAQLNNE